MGQSGQGVLGARSSGRLREEFELVDRQRFVTMRSAEAIRAGVAAADDHNTLAGGEDTLRIRNTVAFADLVLDGEEVHREVNAFEFASGDFEVTRMFRASGQKDGIEVAAQFVESRR